MARIVVRNGQVYDGGLETPRPADVVIEGNRISAVVYRARPHESDHVIDATGCVLMPGLVEGHAHLTFPSGLGSLEPAFNPPLDVSYFLRDHTREEVRQTAARNAGLLLDAGFTSAYSAGSLLPGDTEVWLRDAIAAGEVAGPRLRTASIERDSHFEGHGGTKQGADGDPEGVAAFENLLAIMQGGTFHKVSDALGRAGKADALR